MTAQGRASRRTLILRGILGLLLLAAGTWGFLNRGRIELDRIQVWVEAQGALAPVVFMVAYALSSVAFIPGTVMSLAGGALFGVFWGSVYNVTAATVGSTLSFLLARYLFADAVRRRAGGILQRLLEGVEREGWRFVAFVRLVPLFPFILLNYALGLTRIPLAHFVVASFICMIPGGVAYTYLGYVGREAATGSAGLVRKILIAVALLAILALTPRWVKKLRARKQAGDGQEIEDPS